MSDPNPKWFERAIASHLPDDRTDTLVTQLKAQKIKPEWWTSDTPPEWLSTFLADFQKPEFYDLMWLRDFWIKKGFLSEPDPEWAITQLEAAHQSQTSHTFILHLNVRDFVFDARYGAHRLDRYLIRRYDPATYHFLFYNRSQGFTDPENRVRRTGEERSGRWPGLWGKLVEVAGGASNSQFMEDPTLALQAIERLFVPEDNGKDYRNGVVLFEFAEKVVPSIEISQQDTWVLRQIETLQRWALNEQFTQNKQLVLLLAHNILEVSSELHAPTSQVEQIEIRFPNTHERLKYIAYYYYRARKAKRSIQFDPQDFKVDEVGGQDGAAEIKQIELFADRTAGLNRAAIRDIVLRSWNANAPITNALIQERKTAIIKAESQQLLDVVEPKATLDAVGGLEVVKSFIKDEVIKPLRDPDIRVKRTAPTGVMFLGPPGTGKTILAEALATESGLNMVKLGNFRNSLIGQSERNLGLALKIIGSMTPVLIFMDELDQSEGSRSDGSLDSGVSQRIFQQLITFMSDDSLRGQVVWIAASNRPDLIDAAMKREGRFDDKIPFLTPTIEERQKILAVILEHKLGVSKQHLDNLDLYRFAQDQYSKDFTGAELEVVLTRAMRLAIRRKDDPQIKDKDLETAFKNFMPGQDVTMNHYMTLLALQALNDKRFAKQPHPDYIQYFTDEGKKNNERLDEDIFLLRERLRRT